MTYSVIHLDVVHGAIRMTLPHPHLLKRMEPTIGPMISHQMLSRTGGRDIYEIMVSIGVPETIPPFANRLAEDEIYDEGVGVVAATDDFLWLVFPEKISLKIHRGRRHASIVVHPEHERRIAGSCLLFTLEDAFDLSGQFILHAASLRVPNQDGNILIYAPSGTGKTTTTLSLLSEGFGLCSDDATVLKMENGRATGWGFPRHLKVHQNTVSMLPWLAPLFTNQWNKEGEQSLSRKALASGFSVIDMDPQPILGIFSLARASGSQCAAEPLSPLEAAIELTADNVRVGAAGLLPVQERRLDNLIQMVSTVPVFKLNVGSDLNAVGPTIHQALASIEAPIA